MRQRRPHSWMLRPIARAVILLAFVCNAITAAAQDNTPAIDQVQAVVTGVNSPQHAHQADLILRAEHGVLMSRTDHHTLNLLLHMAPEVTMDQTRLNQLLAPVGMSVRCVERTALGTTRFKHLDPEACDGSQPAAR